MMDDKEQRQKEGERDAGEREVDEMGTKRVIGGRGELI